MLYKQLADTITAQCQTINFAPLPKFEGNQSMIKKLFVAAVFAAATSAMPAQAGTFTLTTTGIIDEGKDNSGVFGVVGQDLKGLTFTQSITISVAWSDWSGYGRYNGYDSVLGYGPALSDTVTVNGKSVTFNAKSASGQMSVSADSYQNADKIYSYLNGPMPKGGSIYSLMAVYASYDFIPIASLNQSIAQNMTLNDPGFDTLSEFRITADTNNAYFSSHHLTSIFMNVPAVPEPETYAMLVVGICLVGARARRRNSRS
jgi:hypothetical protein